MDGGVRGDEGADMSDAPDKPEGVRGSAATTHEEREASAINDAMARALDRRAARPERRRSAATPRAERRTICSYCFQHGDHPTPASCLRALER